MIKISWRKSWAHRNIHGDGNGEGSKRQLLPDERSVWDDYLDLATLGPISGQVCFHAQAGYSPQQLSVLLKTPVEVIERANKKMEAMHMITVENNGIVVINNWKSYQSEYQRQKGYREESEKERSAKWVKRYRALERKECIVCKEKEKKKLEIHHIDRDPTNNDKDNLCLLCMRCHKALHKGGQEVRRLFKEVTDVDYAEDNFEGYKSSNAVDIDIDKRYIRKEYKGTYNQILLHWNSKKVIYHKYLNTYKYGRINGKLDNGFTFEEIKIAINNYAYILKDKKFFWTKEWDLGEFLQRGFDKFMDLDKAKERYACKYREDDLSVEKRDLGRLKKNEDK